MNFDIEEKFGDIIVGIDEVGRGPLAGPVVAVAVYIKRSLWKNFIVKYPEIIKINDSKKLSKKIREKIYKILTNIIPFGVGAASVKEIEELRRAMRINGVKFKVTKNSLTKLALANTKIDTISDLFNGPTAVAYSSDSIGPAKMAVEYEKKFKNFKIIGGTFDGEKIDEEKIKFLASLPTLEEIRSKLVGLLITPTQRITSVLQAPAGQLVRLVNSRSKELEKSN